VEGQIWRELIGPADHRVEMLVGVIAAERGVIAEHIRQVDLREVVAAASGYQQTRSHIERICGVQAGIERRGTQSDWRNVARGLVDEETGAHYRRERVGIVSSQLARGGKLYKPAVDA